MGGDPSVVELYLFMVLRGDWDREEGGGRPCRGGGRLRSPAIGLRFRLQASGFRLQALGFRLEGVVDALRRRSPLNGRPTRRPALAGAVS